MSTKTFRRFSVSRTNGFKVALWVTDNEIITSHMTIEEATALATHLLVEAEAAKKAIDNA